MINKLNNSVSNLEWCTRKENNQHAYDTGLKVGYWKNKSGNENHSSKKVIQFDLFKNEINRFGSASEAGRKTGFSSSQISKCCTGKTKKYKSFLWEYTT